MRTNHRNPWHLLKTNLVLMLCCFLAAPGVAQTPASTDYEVALVRIMETVNTFGGQSDIVISYGDGKFEEIELEGIKAKGVPKENLDTINLVITRLMNAGYDYVGQYESGGMVLIFRRLRQEAD